MSEHARDAGSSRAGRPDQFSLRAQLDRQLAEFAGGPTMAEILADLDQHRRPTEQTRPEIVEALHENRQEREDQLAAIWQP